STSPREISSSEADRRDFSSPLLISNEEPAFGSRERSKSLLESWLKADLAGSLRTGVLGSDTGNGVTPAALVLDGGSFLLLAASFALRSSASRSISSVRKESSGPFLGVLLSSRRTSLSEPRFGGWVPKGAKSSVLSDTILTSLSLCFS